MVLVSEISLGGESALLRSWEKACSGKDVVLPPAGTNYLDSVRASTAAFIESAGHELVSINNEGIRNYVNRFDYDKFVKYVKQVNGWTHKLPLVFDNMAQELNLIALLDLLQFGSGYRKELHTATGRGASDTIRFGCISMHISQTLIDAKGLQALTLGDISQHFDIPLFGDECPMAQGSSAVMVSQASELRPLAECILGCLQDTGKRLELGGYSSLADFIIKMCTEKPSAAHLVEMLANAFPSLRDVAQIEDHQVYLFKKAQLMAYDVCQRFGKTDKMFAFNDIEQLTLFADNVVPAMMQHHGLILPNKNIIAKIENSQPLSLPETTAMRAASIVAAQMVVDYANGHSSAATKCEIPINQATLDNFWWHEGKEPDLRVLSRLIYKDTVYF
ncbi:hypothetical protein BX667DRAFT_504387 [Coemansia mojavensis]|nr:hypothetical protein BX667DRAFT_504387 [Coemansia mojavensis]